MDNCFIQWNRWVATDLHLDQEWKRTKFNKDLLVGGLGDLNVSTKGETQRGWLGGDLSSKRGISSSLMEF